jgi:hypothetical protein
MPSSHCLRLVSFRLHLKVTIFGLFAFLCRKTTLLWHTARP